MLIAAVIGVSSSAVKSEIIDNSVEDLDSEQTYVTGNNVIAGEFDSEDQLLHSIENIAKMKSQVLFTVLAILAANVNCTVIQPSLELKSSPVKFAELGEPVELIEYNEEVRNEEDGEPVQYIESFEEIELGSQTYPEVFSRIVQPRNSVLLRVVHRRSAVANTVHVLRVNYRGRASTRISSVRAAQIGANLGAIGRVVAGGVGRNFATVELREKEKEKGNPTSDREENVDADQDPLEGPSHQSVEVSNINCKRCQKKDKLIRRLRYSYKKEIGKLKQEKEKVIKEKDAMRKMLMRQINKQRKIQAKPSTGEKVDNLIKSIDEDKREEVKKKILFGEIISNNLRDGFKVLRKKEKREFSDIVMRDKDRFKKHKVLDFLNENTTNEVLREVTNPRTPSPTNQFLNRSVAEASQNMKNSSNRAQNNNKITILSDVKVHWTNTSFIGNEMKKTDNTNFQLDFQKFVSGKVAVKDQEKEQNYPDDITESDSARKVLKKDRKAKKKFFYHSDDSSSGGKISEEVRILKKKTRITSFFDDSDDENIF
ncbi:unnamed protein product [Arctia plantaginis]|uniref:Uncharacterized protein n=1 Tax=Arctia plantaginis TaxID=874455 RepID=A0A8S1AK01_ARCPL|nr:unnamed protein product [Arctia plantaginis]